MCGERLHGAAPVPRPGAFVMRDDHRHAAAPPGGERLVERVDDLSDSSRICVVYTPPASPATRASSDELVDVGGGAGRVEHARS